MSDSEAHEPVDQDEAMEAAAASRVPLVILWVVFGILTAYPLFEGISNLVAVPPYYAAIGIGAAVPWWLLIIGVAAPVILYGAALLLGRGRELFGRALILAVALAAANALTLSVIAWAPALQPALK